MKLPEINSCSLEKSFEVKSGALRVTDPCYDMETWCAVRHAPGEVWARSQLRDLG